MDTFVLFLDVCSSTRIMESLKASNAEYKYRDLIEGVYTYLQYDNENLKIDIHKFLGDAFVILFEDTQGADAILEYIVSAYVSIKDHIETFVKKNIDYKIDKIGITGGLAYGQVYELGSKMTGTKEYFGRPLNMASRLQSKNDIENTFLIQNEAYLRINKYGPKYACKETTNRFKNIDNNQEIRCFSFFPEAIVGVHIDDMIDEHQYYQLSNDEKRTYNMKFLEHIKMRMSEIS